MTDEEMRKMTIESSYLIMKCYKFEDSVVEKELNDWLFNFLYCRSRCPECELYFPR